MKQEGNTHIHLPHQVNQDQVYLNYIASQCNADQQPSIHTLHQVSDAQFIEHQGPMTNTTSAHLQMHNP